MNISIRKIEVQPTFRCNPSCSYCIGGKVVGGGKRREQLSARQLTALAREIWKNDIGHVIISAMFGEPLLNVHTPDFIRQVKAGPSSSQYVGLHSNGTKMDEETAVLLTSDNRPGDYVNIHLSSAPSLPDTFKMIHGANSRAQQKVVQEISRLTSRKEQRSSDLIVRINFLLCSENVGVSDVVTAVKELGELGVDEIRISSTIAPIGMEVNAFSATEREIEDVLSIQEYLRSLLKKGKLVFPEDRMSGLNQGNSFGRCYVKDSALV